MCSKRALQIQFDWKVGYWEKKIYGKKLVDFFEFLLKPNTRIMENMYTIFYNTKISKHAVNHLLPSSSDLLYLLYLLSKIDITEAEKKWTSVAMPVYIWLHDEVPNDGCSTL